MRRTIGTLALVLAVAQPLNAQDRRGQSGGTPEAEVFRQAMQALARMAMTAPTDSALWEAGLRGMIESLNDPYAEVYTPDESEEWEERTTGNYSGIGLQITLLNDEITVTAVFRSTPANDAGLQVGDVIVGVDEHDASEWGTDMAADSIRGPVGTDVEVRIKRPGFAEAIPFRITRAEVHVPAVNYGVMDGNVGYVLLDRVARNAAQEMDEALGELEGTNGLIIDLRRNPGGFLDESLLLADLFLEPGAVLASTTQRAEAGPGALASRLGGGAGAAGSAEKSVEAYRDRFPVRVPDLPVIVLVDRYTASGAEIMAGALQDYDRALVLGERTFGKGLVQTVMRLPYGRRLQFTTGEWQTPLGRSLHRPRDMEMRPLDEDLDTFPHVTTPAGRSLVAAGGVFPDIEIQDDTLTLAEREVLRVAGEKEIPLGLRLAELSFDVARDLKEAGRPPELPDARLDAFIGALAAEGIPRSVLDAPGVRDWLAWRARMGIAQRMDEVGREADVRMERDPVLTEATRLLRTATTQAALFRQAADRQASRGGSGGL